MQPHPPDRRGRPANLPVLAARDPAPRAHALGRVRRSPRLGARGGDLAQRGRTPDQQARLHQAGQVDVANRRLMPTPPPGGFAAGLSTGGEAKPYTVTELANEIRRELRPLTALLLKGEVSGMKQGSK